jgi:hypothetical protein
MSRAKDLPPLNFPRPTLVARNGSKHDEVLCLVRRKWVALEPEEWVRQHLISHLTLTLGYPLSLMAVEHRLTLNDVEKRADLVCYNNSGIPVLLAECKAPGIKLSQDTLDQAARYNLVLQVPTLMLTNGLQHYVVATDVNYPVKVLKSIPHFS